MGRLSPKKTLGRRASPQIEACPDLAAIKGLVEVLAGVASALGRAGAMAEIASDACKSDKVCIQFRHCS
jgi:hypothetical protein